MLLRDSIDSVAYVICFGSSNLVAVGINSGTYQYVLTLIYILNIC